MSALRESPLEPLSANLSRPRVWSFPQVRSHGIAVLTNESLILSTPAEPPEPAVLQAFENLPFDVETVLGPTAVVHELAAIRRVKNDLLANSLILDVDYARGGKKRVVLAFETQDLADAFFSKLWRRLGKRVRLVPCKQNFWRLARVPVFVMLAILSATLILAMAASGVEDVIEAQKAGIDPNRASAAMASILGGISWELICAIGGVLAAIVQVWLYRRYTEPPRELELLRN